MVYLHPELNKLYQDSPDNNERQSDDYYVRKKKFLETYLNSNYDMASNYSGHLSPDLIRYNLINTKQITFEVTDACNLNCEYCGYGSLYGDYDNRDNKFMKWELAKAILDYHAVLWRSEEYPSYNKEIAIGFYGGEPLLNIGLIKKVVKYLEDMGLMYIKFRYGMTTNGLLLDKYIDYLFEKGFHVSVSLDGNRENSGYRIAHDGGESFPRIYKNLLSIRERYPEKFESNINFLSVLHSKNSMGNIYKFFKEEFNKMPGVSEVSPNGIRKDKIEEYKRIYKNKFESLSTSKNYSEIREDIFLSDPDNHNLMYYLNNYSGNMIRDYERFFDDVENTRWLPTGTCTPFGKRMFVTVNGKILPCERIAQSHGLGYVDEDGVHLDIDKIAAKYNACYEKLKPVCSMCHRLKGCLQCMFHLENIDNDKPVQCDGFVNKNRFLNYLSRNVSLLERDNKIYHKIMTEVVIEA